MHSRTSLFFGVLVVLAVCPPGVHAADLLHDPLNGSTTGNQNGGSFEGGGWKAPTQVWWDLGTYVTEGGFSVEVTDWDPSAGSAQHHFDKQHIINMYEAQNGSPHASDATTPKTGFWNVRTGAGYNDLFKFLSSTAGFDERHETRNSPPAGPINPASTYTIKVEWTAGGDITVWLDSTPLVTHSHGKQFRLRYVFIGTDNAPGGTYGPQHDVVYKNVRVWGSGGPQPDAGTPDSGGGTDAGTPVELSFEPVADTWTDPENPSTTHGSDVDLRVGGNGAGGEGRTIYLRFDVKGVLNVHSAKVFMRAVNAGGGGGIHVVEDNAWSEAALNWNNRPPRDDTVLSSLGMVDIDDMYSWDVTPAIGGDGLYSFAITSTIDDGSWWHSRESSGMHPYLEIKTSGGGGPDGGTTDGGVADPPSIFSVHPEDPRHFAYDKKPFLFAGKSAFTILARSDSEMRVFVDESAAAGFSQFRVWTMWQKATDPADRFYAVPQDIWPFGGTIAVPDFGTLNTALLDKLERLLRMMADKGIVAEVSPFLCAMDYSVGFNDALKSYIDAVAQRLKNHANAYFEVANEYNHGCYMSGGLPEQFIRDAAARFSAAAPDMLVTVSGGGSLSPSFAGEGWMGIINFHLERNATWWLNAWNVFPQNNSWGKPQVNDEPTGSATQAEYDTWYKDYMGGLGRDPNADHFRWAMYIAAVSGGHFTFHYHKGVTAEPGTSPGMEFVGSFRKAFEDNVDYWLIEPDRVLVQNCPGGQCFSAAAGGQRLLYVLDGGGSTVSFDTGGGDRILKWIDPSTGQVAQEWAAAGGVQDLTVPAGQDAFFVSVPKAAPQPDGGTTEDGGQPTEDGGQTTEDGSELTEDGGTDFADASPDRPATGDAGEPTGGDWRPKNGDGATGSADESAGGCGCATFRIQ
ncbi:MAG: DNRLRE domain-containing protein [Deltaproteobacteria bacterium]|nr:DNRLRE domain-containing protein [Deltaproteobacteria bacterium]